MTAPTRRERLRPWELVGLAAVFALFTGAIVLLATRLATLTLIFAGIAFIVALVMLAMFALTTTPAAPLERPVLAPPPEPRTPPSPRAAPGPNPTASKPIAESGPRDDESRNA